MKALLVSRVALSERIISELRNSGITEFVDYFGDRKSWRNSDDIEKAAKESGCDTVIVIANFRVAMELLAKGFKRIYVIKPKYYTTTEIVAGDVVIVEGSVKAMVKSV